MHSSFSGRRARPAGIDREAEASPGDSARSREGKVPNSVKASDITGVEMAKQGAKKRRKKEDDLVARLAFVLLRYFRGWWDKVKLVKAGGFLPSQVTMWDHGDRPVPWDALQRTADATGFPRYLLGAALRMIRSFLLAAKGRSRPNRALAEVSIVELFPLAFSAL